MDISSAAVVMEELTVADLKPLPSVYNSSRSLFDVLIGEDTALPLIEASSSGNVTTLRSMLSQPQWIKIAFEEPHCIYSVDRPSYDTSDIRGVHAMPISNLERAIFKAAENGHAAAVSTLLDFASHQGVKPSSVIHRWVVDKTIKNGHAAVFEALASADPAVVTFPLGHGTLPLDLAVAHRQTEVVAVLLQLGADPGPSASHRRAGSYGSSLLSRAAKPGGTRITELLLRHGVSPARSGALHLAAELGVLDTIHLLMQHGADVNELLPEEILPRYRRSLFASWTPMHFAASRGQADAMKLLESNGARSDLKDENGKTPAELLKEHK